MPTSKKATQKNTGTGEYYHIEVRPKKEFETFRYQDVGEPGHILRLAGKRANGSWDDHAWLIDKDMAHIEGTRLVGDTKDARDILSVVGPAKHVKGDIFKGRPKDKSSEKKQTTRKSSAER